MMMKKKKKGRRGRGGRGRRGKGKGGKGGEGGEGEDGDGADFDTSGGIAAVSKIDKNPNMYSYVPKQLLALLKSPLKDRLIDPKIFAQEDELNC